MALREDVKVSMASRKMALWAVRAWKSNVFIIRGLVVELNDHTGDSHLSFIGVANT
jgi:hypothetical protein